MVKVKKKPIQIEENVSRVVERLKEEYNPQKVILFGSASRDNFNKDSDLDFFIVKETNKPRFERQLEVQNIFIDREIAMDFLVYTPEELKERIELGDPFVENILNQGRILYERE